MVLWWQNSRVESSETYMANVKNSVKAAKKIPKWVLLMGFRVVEMLVGWKDKTLENS